MKIILGLGFMMACSVSAYGANDVCKFYRSYSTNNAMVSVNCTNSDTKSLVEYGVTSPGLEFANMKMDIELTKYLLDKGYTPIDSSTFYKP